METFLRQQTASTVVKDTEEEDAAMSEDDEADGKVQRNAKLLQQLNSSLIDASQHAAINLLLTEQLRELLDQLGKFMVLAADTHLDLGEEVSPQICCTWRGKASSMLSWMPDLALK